MHFMFGSNNFFSLSLFQPTQQCNQLHISHQQNITNNNRAYQKMEEKNGKPKIDFTVLDPKRAALTSVWALGITPLAINVISSTVNQFNNEPGPCVSKAFEGLGICSEYIPK